MMSLGQKLIAIVTLVLLNVLVLWAFGVLAVFSLVLSVVAVLQIRRL
jgi:hypothetical protein